MSSYFLYMYIQKQTVRRHRVNFMSGQHRVAHFFNARETPASDVIQVAIGIIMQ